jgi:uncharacterized protein (DUF302 family)
VTRSLRALLLTAGAVVPAVIAIVAMSGALSACRILEVCNPHQAKKVLAASLEISTALPYERTIETIMAEAAR